MFKKLLFSFSVIILTIAWAIFPHGDNKKEAQQKEHASEKFQPHR